MPTTLIHTLSRQGTCTLCGDPIPPGHCALPGEFVGVIRYVTIPSNSYRVGRGNADRMCDGRAAGIFHQDSKRPS